MVKYIRDSLGRFTGMIDDSRSMEFFENNEGLRSMPRLIAFAAFWPSSYVLIVTKDPTIFGIYTTVFALQYLGGKGLDVWEKKKAVAKKEVADA
jgi:hypothetical protein